MNSPNFYPQTSVLSHELETVRADEHSHLMMRVACSLHCRIQDSKFSDTESLGNGSSPLEILRSRNALIGLYVFTDNFTSSVHSFATQTNRTSAEFASSLGVLFA